MSKPWKTNTLSQSCPAPALTEKRIKRYCCFGRLNHFWWQLRYWTPPAPRWAENQKISCKNDSILVWAYLQCCVTASIAVKSSVLLRKLPWATVCLGLCPSREAEVMLCTAGLHGPRREMQGDHSTWHVTRTEETQQRSYSYCKTFWQY